MNKLLGIYHDIKVVAYLPEHPMELPYCICYDNNTGQPLTQSVLEFQREDWDNQQVLTECFNHAVGIGLTTYLEKETK